jgi:hypothetical protein
MSLGMIGHARLGVVDERHRPGEHVFEASFLQSASDVDEEVGFAEYGGGYDWNAGGTPTLIG